MIRRTVQLLALVALCGCQSARPGAEVVILKRQALNHVHATYVGSVRGEAAVFLSENEAVELALENLKGHAARRGGNAVIIERWRVVQKRTSRPKPWDFHEQMNASRISNMVIRNFICDGSAYIVGK